ncbi:MAG: hypothetical protein IH964_07560 [Candidatus Dadabacteria bacterium]|nr:hypothetical protein [Candidatus Dadabacteria bacterium]
MSIRNILIIVLIIVLIVLFFRNRGNFRTYELKGKITMVNNCTNNTADLTDKIRIKAKLYFQGSTSAENFNKSGIPAVITNATTREATYSLKITTSDTAKEWKVESITSDAFSEICDPIPCPTPRDCINMATGNVYTVPVPSGQTVITKDYRFSCVCMVPPPPPPEPTPEPQ